MRLCDTCVYRNEDEYHKPCIVYRDDCEHYEKERGDMTDKQILEEVDKAMKLGARQALDKVRAEIVQLRNHNDYLDEQGVTIMEVLQIIDKYKAESEEL